MRTLTLTQRLNSLSMPEAALAKRSRLPLATVREVLAHPDTAPSEARAKVQSLLGLLANGQPIVTARTYRKHIARKKARFVVSQVQGTMGLEAQGLTPQGKEALYRKTVRRMLASHEKMW